jgi:hypothetical protein
VEVTHKITLLFHSMSGLKVDVRVLILSFACGTNLYSECELWANDMSKEHREREIEIPGGGGAPQSFIE